MQWKDKDLSKYIFLLIIELLYYIIVDENIVFNFYSIIILNIYSEKTEKNLNIAGENKIKCRTIQIYKCRHSYQLVIQD